MSSLRRLSAFGISSLFCLTTLMTACGETKSDSKEKSPSTPPGLSKSDASSREASSGEASGTFECPSFTVNLPKEKFDAAQAFFIYAKGEKYGVSSSRFIATKSQGALKVSMQSCSSLPPDTYAIMTLQLIYSLQDGRVTSDDIYVADQGSGKYKLKEATTEMEIARSHLEKNPTSILDKIDERYHAATARVLSRGCELNLKRGFSKCAVFDPNSAEQLDEFFHDLVTVEIAIYNDAFLSKQPDREEMYMSDLRDLERSTSQIPAFVSLTRAVEAKMRALGKDIDLSVNKVVTTTYGEVEKAIDAMNKMIKEKPDAVQKIRALDIDKILFYDRTSINKSERFAYISVNDDSETIYESLK